MTALLLVEDDTDVRDLLSSFLSGYGIKTFSATSLAQARELLTMPFDIAVIDLMLPDGDGLTLCREIRVKSDAPIIISSAKGDLGSKILGYEFGADDYMAKPYEPRELALKINALLRRSHKVRIVYGELSLCEESREAYFDDVALDLTKSEYELLSLFMTHPHKAFSRSELAHHLGIDDKGRSIDTHVSNLRLKIGDEPKNPQFIHSVWGIGYKFIGDKI